MAFHFDRDDIALPGFYKFFKKAADEKNEHAQKFMKFQNKRGGRIVLADIKMPERNDWGTGLEAMKKALDLETHVNTATIDLRNVAGEGGDHHMAYYLEEFLEEQVQRLKELADHVTRLKRAGPGLGEHIYDKDLA